MKRAAGPCYFDVSIKNALKTYVFYFTHVNFQHFFCSIV